MKVPRGSRVLRAYVELESYIRDFVDGRYRFLWIYGRYGLGKSESITRAISGRPHYYRKAGQLTPLQFYKDAYELRDGVPIILDDPRTFLENSIGRNLISALGDTSRIKQVGYGTTRSLGTTPDGKDKIPQTFESKSHLCIIANHSSVNGELESRAITLFFDPTNEEIHRSTARWFWDQEIHDWFGQHVYRMQPIDVRWYLEAADDKAAYRDWRQNLLDTRALNRVQTIVQDLELDSTYAPGDDKAAAFEERMGSARGRSRASYYRIRKRLEDAGTLVAKNAVSRIPLVRTTPPGDPSDLELEAAAQPPPLPPVQVDKRLDLPAHERFRQPINGTVANPGRQHPSILDDRLPWEGQDPDEGQDGEQSSPEAEPPNAVSK